MAKSPRKTGAQSTSKMAVIGDTLSNVIIGLGTDKEKLAGTRFALNEMDQTQANMAYRGDWVARKIVDIPAADATREWRSWQADAKDITAIEKLERTLGIQKKTRTALIRARLHGGSVMILGVDDGQTPDQPLNLNRVKRDSLKFVHTLSRWAITAGEIDRDPISPFYGEPKYYRTQSSATGGQTTIHPSRVVRFQGLERPDAELSTGSDGAWGDSVLQIVSDAVRSTGLVTSSVAQLVSEAKIDVVKVPDLSENLTAQGYEQLLQQRFANVNVLKSVFGFLVLDSEESYEQQATAFTGLPDIMRMFLMMVCGAADIPATRFMAQSPNGMSSTGDSDTRNYYDRLASDQNMDMTPALARLDEVLLRSALGSRPEELFYNWNSLWQMDDAQAAEIAVKKANVFKIDVDSGLLDSVVLKKAREAQLVEDGTYPGLEAIIDEFDGQGEEQQQEEQQIDPATGAPIDPTGAIARVQSLLAKGGAKPATPKAPDPKTAAKDFNPYHEPKEPNGAALKDESTPRSLYMRRDVLNAKDIRSWAKSQGFQTAMPANQMHVTIIYSKEPVDWLKIGSNDWGADKDGNITIAPGGPRVVEQFGEAIVLAFSNSDLAYRNMRAREEGASYDFPDYTPHITFTYNLPPHIDLANVEPYRGKIILGPEIFEEIKQSFDPKTMLVEDKKKERKL